MKHIKLWENFTTSAYDDIPVGTKVERSMGIRKTGVVIPWFNWRDATDGTYSEPDRDRKVAVLYDDGTKGFESVAYLTIIHKNGKKEPMGRLISDEEYDTTSDDNIIVDFDSDSSGTVEFEDGTVDSFIIYDNGKIAFDGWYPSAKNKLLINLIKQKITKK